MNLPPFGNHRPHDCMQQTGPMNEAQHVAICYLHARRLPSLSQCRLSVSKMGVVLRWIWSEVKGQYYWDVIISTNVRCYQICRRWRFSLSAAMHWRIVRATQFNCWCTKFVTFFLPSYGPPNSPQPNATDYKTWTSYTIQHHQYKLRVNTIEEIKEWLFEVWQSG